MATLLPHRPARPDHERRKQKAITLAVGQYNHGLYFECHETLEEIWLEESGEDRLFLQGLIQAAAGLHNLQRGRFLGPARLLRAAHEKLLPYGASHLGVDLSALCEELTTLHRQAVARDERGADWNPHPRPSILYREPPYEYN